MSMTVCFIVKTNEEHAADVREQLNRISGYIRDDLSMDALNEIGARLDELEELLEDE